MRVAFVRFAIVRLVNPPPFPVKMPEAVTFPPDITTLEPRVEFVEYEVPDVTTKLLVPDESPLVIVLVNGPLNSPPPPPAGTALVTILPVAVTPTIIVADAPPLLPSK